jgi:hypothetical protein
VATAAVPARRASARFGPLPASGSTTSGGSSTMASGLRDGQAAPAQRDQRRRLLSPVVLVGGVVRLHDDGARSTVHRGPDHRTPFAAPQPLHNGQSGPQRVRGHRENRSDQVWCVDRWPPLLSGSDQLERRRGPGGLRTRPPGATSSLRPSTRTPIRPAGTLRLVQAHVQVHTVELVGRVRLPTLIHRFRASLGQREFDRREPGWIEVALDPTT